MTNYVTITAAAIKGQFFYEEIQKIFVVSKTNLLAHLAFFKNCPKGVLLKILHMVASSKSSWQNGIWPTFL